MEKVNFLCECGCTTLEEVLTNSVISYEISELQYEDEWASCEYSEPTVHDASIDRYQCSCCGKTVKNEYGDECTTLEEVSEVLLKRSSKND